MNNKIIVQKFGGTSVSTPERRQQVIAHVRQAQADGYKVVLVVSAMGRSGDPYATDTLLDLLRDDGNPVSKRDYDMVYVCGEIISTTVMSHQFKAAGINAVGLNGAQAGVHTDGNHSEADIVEVDPSRLLAHLERGELPIVSGSQGVFQETGDFTTLGRGGSDTSAVALGVALKAEKVEIFTDVAGIARTDPRKAPSATLMKQVNADSMLEMARYGARVIHPRAVRIGRDGGVPVVVRATGSDAAGTAIADVKNETSIVGIASLGGLDGLLLPTDSVGAETRAEWEQSRLIMSLVDDKTGELLLTVSAEKAHELAAVKGGLKTAVSTPSLAWITLIGEAGAIQTFADKGRALLADAGIEVMWMEGGENGRCTYVIIAENEGRAVNLLYQQI